MLKKLRKKWKNPQEMKKIAWNVLRNNWLIDHLKVLCIIIGGSDFDKTLRINYGKYDEKNVMISDTEDNISNTYNYYMQALRFQRDKEM